MKIYLIRHGESTSDVNEKYDGDYDDHLTEKGREDARKIANELLGKSIQAIFSSARIRAKETATILKEEFNCKTIIVDGLNEQDIYGALTELSKNQPEEEYRKLGELLVNRDSIVEGVEPYENFKNRVVKAFVEISNSNYDSIAIITHGGLIRCIFREVLRIEEPDKIENGAIVELEKSEIGLKIIKVK